MIFLTLYEKRNWFVEWMKPKIKYLTSIDFGKTVYHQEVGIIVFRPD